MWTVLEYFLRMLTCPRTYIERKPREPEFPSLKPSVADFVIDSKDDASIGDGSPDKLDMEGIDLDHGPPG